MLRNRAHNAATIAFDETLSNRNNTTIPQGRPPSVAPVCVVPEFAHLLDIDGELSLEHDVGSAPITTDVASQMLEHTRSHAEGHQFIGEEHQTMEQQINNELANGHNDTSNDTQVSLAAICPANHLNKVPSPSNITSHNSLSLLSQDLYLTNHLACSATASNSAQIASLENTISLSASLIRELHRDVDNQRGELETREIGIRNLVAVLDKANEMLREAYRRQYALMQELEGLLERERVARKPTRKVNWIKLFSGSAQKYRVANGIHLSMTGGHRLANVASGQITKKDRGTTIDDGFEEGTHKEPILALHDLKKVVNVSRQNVMDLRDRLQELIVLVNGLKYGTGGTGIQPRNKSKP